MGIDSIVTLNISRSAAAVSRAGFGTALILGSNATGWGTDRVRTYTSPAALLDDGFETGDMEYKAALALYSQPNKPTRFKVGKRAAGAAVAQVTTFTPNVSVQAEQDFVVEINDEVYTLTSDDTPTAAEIVSGLIAMINADDVPVTASGTNTLILTSDTAGMGFRTASSANMSGVLTTPNVGIQSDLNEIKAIDNDWYGLILCDRTANTIVQAAAWIQAERKVFVACSSDSAVIAAGTSDVASRLKAAGYDRTLYLYSADQANMPEGAVLGNALPYTPGSYTLKFKTLVGITVDALTESQITIAKGKNANVYTTVAGAGMLEEGIVASGEFFDVIVGIDWIHVNMQADIFQGLRDVPKIPYTDVGASVIEAKIRKRLQLAVSAQILAEDPAFSVTTLPRADQDPADKAARRWGGWQFTGTLAGAIHAVAVNGYVSV